MAPITPAAETEKTPQGIQNLSFDKDFDVLAMEMLGYDSSAGVLRRLRVNSNGQVITDVLAYGNLVGTTGSAAADSSNDTITFASGNGVTSVVSDTAGNSVVTISTPQDVRTTASPTFNNLTLTGVPSVGITQDYTGDFSIISFGQDFYSIKWIASDLHLHFQDDTSGYLGIQAGEGVFDSLRLNGNGVSGDITFIDEAGFADAATTPTATGRLRRNDGSIMWHDGVAGRHLFNKLRKNSAGTVFSRPQLNLIESANIVFTVADDGTDGEIDITPNLTTLVAAGTYNQVTVDIYGRVTAGALVINSYYTSLTGTSGSATAIGDANITFASSNGVTSVVSDGGTIDTVTISTPQDIRTSASPTFNALTLSNPLTTANGGTGLASYTQGDLIYYDTGTTFTKLAKNTTATRYLSNTGTSNNPAWAQVSLTNGITGTLGATNGGTGQSTVTTGDLLYGSATDTWSKLAGVAAGSYLRSGGVTTAPLWSTLILPNSATANRVPYATATNTWGDSANMTFDGNKFSLAAATSEANGLRLGTTVDLYNDTTDRLRLNDRITSVTSFTATSGSWIGINSSATGTPTGASSARMWGLQFFADATGTENWTASNGGIIGLEGFARNSGSGTVTTALGATAYVSKASTGAITTAKAYIGWVQNNDTTNDIGTAIVYHADTFINTGHVTSWTGLLTGGPAFSADSQTRFGISISAMPNPATGGFASTTVFAINIAGTSTTGRDGIRFGADSSAVVYRSASATVATIAAFTVGTNLTVTGGSATLSTVLGAVDAGGATSFEIPNGAGGTAISVAGQVTIDTTSRTLNLYDGTAEVVLDPLIVKAFTIPLPASTDDYPTIRVDRAATLVKVVYAISGGTNWVGQIQEADDAQGTGAADTQAADSTVTGTTTVTSFTNASFDAGDYFRVKTTSVSGVVTWLNINFYYRMNP